MLYILTFYDDVIRTSVHFSNEHNFWFGFQLMRVFEEKPHKGKCGPQKVIYVSQELRKDITILVEQISLFCKLVARTDTMKAFIAISCF